MMAALSRGALEGIDVPLARRVEYHEEIHSTQGRARELAREDPGAPHGTLVVARVQTGGKGRLGRRWGSPAGGLWMSLVLRPDVPVEFAARITQAAAVGVAKTLQRFGVQARIKWPNDLLVGGAVGGAAGGALASGRKICGILAESGIRPVGRPGARRLDFVVLGVGLNANLDPEGLGVADREATTLRAELGRDVDLLHLLGTLLNDLDAEIRRLEDFGAVLDDWRALDCTLGERVRVHRSGEVLEGKAVDLNPEGALILETENGSVELFEGEIEYLRSEA